MSVTYKTCQQASKSRREDNDCAVIAVSIVSNHPYDYVHEIFRQHGRKNRRGTPRHMTRSVVRELGMFMEGPIEFEGKTIKSLRLPKDGRFLIVTRGHILAAINGKICDWTSGRKHRPKCIWRCEW